MISKPKVALVGGSLSSYAGGAPRSMATHAVALRTQGVPVTIFTGFSKKYPLTLEQFPLNGVEIVASRLWGPSVLGLNAKALWQLFKRARQYDIIHLNGHWNLTTFIGATIAKLRNIPYVITVRGHLGTYDFRHLRILKLLLYPLMEIPNIRGAAAMHVCSEWEQQDSMRALKHAQSIVKLPNAVDLKSLLPILDREIARENLNLPQDVPVFLFLSRVSPDKSTDLLIRSWAQSARGLDGAILVIAGPCAKYYARELTTLARSLGVVDSIRFPGYADNEAKRFWLSAADVFVLPSTDDSFSVAAIEAAFFGLHCVLSPFVGATEFIPPYQVTVVSLNERMWAEALSTVHSERVRSPESLMECLSTKTLGIQWQRLYQQLISHPVNDSTSQERCTNI